MNEKHAYLIMSHNQFDLLKILLKSLDFSKNDIYLHIDKKVGKIDYNQFYECLNESRLYILENRLDVSWGDFSQIQCEINLLEKALQYNYQYYHLMSGVDMPLKTQNEIHEFFNNNYGTEFVHFENQNIDKDTYDRVSKYHFFGGKNKSFIKKIINFIFIKLQFSIDRVKKSKLKFQKGANWFSITNQLARYIVENKKNIKKIFKYTRCADEMFLQTLIVNSDFIKNISKDNFSDNYDTIMYFIDWKRGNPYEFTNEDYEILINSNMLFARKFNWNKDNTIIRRIYDDIKERRE